MSNAPHASPTVSSPYDASDPHRTEIKKIVERAAELLPMQGPITAFAFLNPLQALEPIPFEEGLLRGARLNGCQPYLPEEKYRERLIQGRIKLEELVAELRLYLGVAADKPVKPSGTLQDLWMSMLKYPMRTVKEHEMQWFLAETDSLRKMRPETSPSSREKFITVTREWVLRDLARDRSNGNGHHSVHNSLPLVSDLMQHFGADSIEAWSRDTWEAVSLNVLYRICREGVHAVPQPPPIPDHSERHRDLVLAATNQDADVLVDELLVRFCAAYTDQGMAQVELPLRDAGFYKAFEHLYGQEGGLTKPWMQNLPAEMARIRAAGLDPLGSIHESLDLLGVRYDQWDEYITEELLALRGWAGMLWQMETRDDRFAIATPAGTQVEFFAIRLILERLALKSIAEEAMGYAGELRDLAAEARRRSNKAVGNSNDQRAFLVFELAQFMGWLPRELHELTKTEWAELVTQIESVTGLQLRGVFHKAFEARMRTQVLDTLSNHCSTDHISPPQVSRPRFQTCFCIDAREESFRRYQEEYAPDTETFAFAGFYAVAMYYKGIADAHFAALCPIVVRPKHWVVEDPVPDYEKTHQFRSRARRALGAATYQVHVDSRSFIGGTVLTAGLGILASIPLVGRVLFPTFTGRLRQSIGKLVQPPRITRLRLERSAPNPGPSGNEIGYTVEEMANIGERVLRDIALTKNFARLVIFFGHGSFGLNNPHMSAYNCGACSGGSGGPNARALALMLNDKRIRDILAARGLAIPGDTVFVGGQHNTCEDILTYADIDLIPASHLPDFEDATRTLNEVCRRNAQERCRRFYSASLKISTANALRHVQRRAQDLAQPRAEYGNASNALCFVGRRSRIRGLFFDRRAFLHSYDAAQDDANYSILARILAPVVPVCAGINMQYFFSAVDTEGWACGSKLPHNVASLLGVMNGAASDLRSGLPTQGVEIHEPMRLLYVIESTPTALLKIMGDNPIIGGILGNEWGQLAILDPNSPRIQLYRNGKFEDYKPTTTELPHAASSFDWFVGRRDHLGFAEIDAPPLPPHLAAGMASKN